MRGLLFLFAPLLMCSALFCADRASAATPQANSPITVAAPPHEQVPRFTIPQARVIPTIDGSIRDDEWADAMRFEGMSPADDWTRWQSRRGSFLLKWSPTHLFIAARSELRPGEILLKKSRTPYALGLVFDDSYEFGLFLFDRNKKPDEVSFLQKFTLNSLGAGEYLKIYPSIGQYLYNWRPKPQIASAITSDGKWWDMEIALSLADMQLPAPMQSGEALRIMLARNFKNPWAQVHVPSSTGFLVSDGYPAAVLTDSEPFARIENLTGLDRDAINLTLSLCNPSTQEVTLDFNARVGASDARQEPVIHDKRTMKLAPGQRQQITLQRDKLGIDYSSNATGQLDLRVIRADAPADANAPEIFRCFFRFKPDPAAQQPVTFSPPSYFLETDFNPERSSLWIEGDTLDAQILAGKQAVSLRWRVTRDNQKIAQGTLNQLVMQKFQGLATLPALQPGKYQLDCDLIDAAGNTLVTQQRSFEKKDEPREFASWWGQHIGNPDQVLRPFKPLVVEQSPDRVTISPVLRRYELDALGLPRQIESNGKPLLAAPARLIVTLAGQEHVVPTTGTIHVLDTQPWRVRFTGKASVAGIEFTTTGFMEQDGLVDLSLSYRPTGNQVTIDSLRLEWPVDDTLRNHMSTIGPGGNFSARAIGAVPAGQGRVWDALSTLGRDATGMTVGSFLTNFWIGTEQRGLLWAGDSDRGWVPNDAVSSHEIYRSDSTLTLRNNFISRTPGQSPFTLDSPRTIRFQYNASPFKPLEPGWRLFLVSAANGFSDRNGPYKFDPQTNFDGWAKLSPPSTDVSQWPRFYAAWKPHAEYQNMRGIYGTSYRMHSWNNNQFPLRGYEPKTAEPGVYDYFRAAWLANNQEILTDTYCDYMLHLMRRQVREGGCRNFYADISMVGQLFGLAADVGYQLPDGRVQPDGGCDGIRRWHMRVTAMMQNEGFYPAGNNGHATNSFSLKALPFMDAVLDSEFPMPDPISVYPSDRMIALSCPHNFGSGISHLQFMNPHWATMHDANVGGGDGPFNHPEFRHWGIARGDVRFVPYWRNRDVVTNLAPGLRASLWHRPNSVVIAILNHDADSGGNQVPRAIDLTLNAAALGVPANLKPHQYRIREFMPAPILTQFASTFAWFERLPWTQGKNNEKFKLRPAANLQFDPATARITGAKLEYHDIRYLVLSWDEVAATTAVSSRLNAFPSNLHEPLRDWQLDAADTQVLTPEQVTQVVKWQGPGAMTSLYRRPGSALFRIENRAASAMTLQAQLDLKTLGVKVEPGNNHWQQFTQIYDLQPGEHHRIVQDVFDNALKMREHDALKLPGGIVFDGWHDGLFVRLAPGQVRVFTIDTY